MRSIVLAVALAACSAQVNPNGRPDGGDACSGTATRCLSTVFQTCVGGVFTTKASCPNACDDTLGCVQCLPSAGNACNGNNVVACNADGTFGATVTACGSGMMCIGGGCTTSCTADGVDLVYVVDEQNDFMSFDPRKLPSNPFTTIGTLNCPTTGPSILINVTNVVPFSMSIDRNGIAWVLYTSGELFKVSLANAICTAAGNTVGAGGMNLFGMGFVTNGAMSDGEKLYLSGGNTDPSASPKKLAYDDTHGGNLTPTRAGTITASPAEVAPELTGTNEGKLYGFFPNLTQVAYVQEISKTDGSAVGMTWNLGNSGLGTNVNDWAFAQWGGTFYIFVTTSDSGNANRNSTVRTIDRMTGQYTTVLDNLNYYIDGAGVSTCAPTTLQ
jgi:hypothetical protein